MIWLSIWRFRTKSIKTFAITLQLARKNIIGFDIKYVDLKIILKCFGHVFNNFKENKDFYLITSISKMSKRERILKIFNSSLCCILFYEFRLPRCRNRKRSTALILLSTIERFIVSSNITQKKKKKKVKITDIFIFIKCLSPRSNRLKKIYIYI